MFGILSIMNEQRKRQHLKQSMEHREKITFAINKQTDTIFNTLKNKQSSFKNKCFISDCNKIDIMGNKNIQYYECTKYYND